VSEKFEKGDVVTHAWFAAFPGEYTVTGLNYSNGARVEVQQKGREYAFITDDLTLVRKANPEVRKGDRVRMTYEGVVTKVYAGGKPEIDHRYVEGAPDAVQILERAKPDLRPGDVVVNSFSGIYLIGHRNVHYTSTVGSVIDAGETPDSLAARIASNPDRYTHIKHSDLKGFKA
jgi:hypothetical protein